MRGRRDDAVDVLLVTDDDEATRRIDAAFGELDVDTSVRVATDESEALRILTESTDLASGPDLVLLEPSLPRTDGLELLERIADDPALLRLPILVLARPGDAEAISESYRLGANAALEKPTDSEGYAELVEAVADFWFRRAALPADDG